MNVARLNFSHGSHEEQLGRINMIKKLRSEMGVPIAILLDTKGPEIRIGKFENGSIMLEQGQKFTLTTQQIPGNENIVSVSYSELPYRLKEGDKILIDDGLIELMVTDITDSDINCIVRNGGKLSNKKSINLPGINLDMPYMTEKDREDILFGIEQDVDFIAASFVRNKNDIMDVLDILDANKGKNIKVIAKIENSEGVENIDSILELANGIMIARGDMGVEISFEKLPHIQKMLIKKCYAAGKMAITATQMLDSMMHNPRPTRAEVTDVANAVYDGTSAIMLSGETAAGKYPVESVITMSEIAESTENTINYTGRFLRESVKNNSVTDAICHAACTTAIDLHATAIVALTLTGHTARMLSKYRPSCPILAATTCEKNYNQLALSWGVVPVMNDIQKNTDALFASAVKKITSTSLVRKRDRIVITGGSDVDTYGETDTMKVYTI
ncbi:MAG: pyruvate kinase, partial [Clostridia bacterium]|nr:pyruvate kinase [Clostridia bacterium]